jgi:dTDP-4-amino-4,6-dideoxygalactose transaminase
VNLDPSKVEEAITTYQDIEVIAPVIFGGATDGIPEVCALAKAAGKLVVEDAAHGLGASYHCGAMVGSCKYSDCTVFSLHPVKSIAGGEGGVITTNDEAIYGKLLRLRSHGINKNDDPLVVTENAFTNGLRNPWYYEMQDVGFHYRNTDIQISLASSQLDKIEAFLSRRRELVRRYRDRY